MSNRTPAAPEGLNGAGLRIGIVSSRFNAEICAALTEAAEAELRRLGVADTRRFSVPGALEIPLLSQTLAQSGGFDALIALGAVIRGETYHFEVVSNDACRGVMETQLETGVPIANGILTCESDEQALARAAQKGEDCARAAVEMARRIRDIKDERARN
ncbi:MAG: 6,7-dimethyl-8-ribityllumazine synthase [Zoogloeaceae bacterium]|jgi:6,7-dimethyl-8-ribityllumazine synthase|nr:6,7-dimethyl-8-ribityllumazine synthase [Zoogloeaceae bacterium]